MNKKKFENWLNEQDFAPTIWFFCNEHESGVLYNTIIEEHGQDYFDEVLSNFINKELERIININDPTIEIDFVIFYHCFSLTNNIAKKIAHNVYLLAEKHLAKEFEIATRTKAFYKNNLPSKYINSNGLIEIFNIIKANRNLFSNEQVQTLFNSFVNVLEKRENQYRTDDYKKYEQDKSILDNVVLKRNPEWHYPRVDGIKLSEIKFLTNLIQQNPFLNTAKLEKIILEKPKTKCEDGDPADIHFAIELLLFAQAVNADPIPYVEKIRNEIPDLHPSLLTFFGFNLIHSRLQYKIKKMEMLKPIENLDPEFKQECRDSLLLIKPRQYQDLIEEEKIAQKEKEFQQQKQQKRIQRAKKSKFFRLIYTTIQEEFEKTL